MSESVLITPRAAVDGRGNPRAVPGPPFTLTALEVAPGNTMRRFGIGGDLNSVAFTVYLPLRDEGRVLDDYGITVRDLVCTARVQVWKSGGRGVLAILAQSSTGKGGG